MTKAEFRKKIGFIFLLIIPISGEIYLREHIGAYSNGYKQSNNPKLIYELEPNFEIKSISARTNQQIEMTKPLSFPFHLKWN